jgi:hypothetical protein
MGDKELVEQLDEEGGVHGNSPIPLGSICPPAWHAL